MRIVLNPRPALARSSRVSCERIAYFLGGDCCAAGFQAGLRPLWVTRVRPKRFRLSRHVRFAPKADK
jgi:hypothetical protein